MSLTASRAVLRRSHFAMRRAGVRHASSQETANAAKQKAAEFTTKAQEGLSRVASMAGPALGKAGEYTVGAIGAIGKMGGPIGKAFGFVNAAIPQVVYYSKVGLELGKVVFEAQKMSPPSMQTFQAYFQPALNALKNPAAFLSQTSAATDAAVSRLQPTNLLNQVRNIDRRQLAVVGVTTAEVIGFFSVGEIIGRMKIVGYRSSGHSHGDH